jgi:DNA-binding NarL/FixJ family response regulator
MDVEPCPYRAEFPGEGGITLTLAPTHCRASIQVLLVDDQKAARHGLAALLSTFGDIEVIGSAADGAGAVRQALALAPDLILMDVRMQSRDGLDAMKRIKAIQPRTAIVVHSMDGSLREEAESLGADAFLLKGCSVEELVSTIRTVSSRLDGPGRSGSRTVRHPADWRTG